MNILVCGANGQLGRELRSLAPVSVHRYIFSDIAASDAGETLPLDICDREGVRKALADNDIDILINCAAFTDVEGAEDRPELAERLNGYAPAVLAEAMKERGGLLVHISTDYVFGMDSGNRPLGEESSGSPCGVYGLSKLHGEQAVTASGCRHLILRTAWLYSEYGRNFVKTILRLSAEKPQIKVVFDQCGSPTYALDLAEAIFTIVEKGLYEGREGIYNYSNEGVCSWYDFAVEIAAASGHDKCTIVPCHSDEFPSKVTRPPYSVLDKSKFKKCFGLEIPHWRQSLLKCLSGKSMLQIAQETKK